MSDLRQGCDGCRGRLSRAAAPATFVRPTMTKATHVRTAVVLASAVACAGNGSPTSAAHGATDSVAQTPGTPTPPPTTSTHDWTRFGWDAARSNAATVATGI